MHRYRTNSLISRRPKRRGYALVLVSIFVVLFLAMLGVAWRHTASALRIASIRAVQMRRDEGSLPALARALHLLESGLPPSSPYVCGTTVTTSTGPRAYTITFVQEGDVNWSVHCNLTPSGDSPTPMPDSFVPAP